ncbi:MAG: LdpA C-terminal domain-containing domain [Synechococcaceae cyanobacterium]|nr:LdpA C-terminal domain-containing domain [Synechococcaceae cyanobacterium]
MRFLDHRPSAGSCATPDGALAEGRWVKWIGGASNQDLTAIEDLAGLYSAAGVHCLDLAADPAVVAAARRGVRWARERTQRSWREPWLMVSLSDGSDPHFRKAWFDPELCPAACPRPCERVCPALAIPPRHATPPGSGVLEAACYGCGRCLSLCPAGLIEERQVLLEGESVAPLLRQLRPDAIELHTRPGRQHAFRTRLAQVSAAGVPLQRLAVSCGLDDDDGARIGVEPLAAELWQRFAALRAAGFRPLWQLDGRPMSGDIGAGTANAAVQLLQRISPLAPPGPLTLAGGTNAHSLPLIEAAARSRSRAAGVAFGGSARALLQPLLLEAQGRQRRLLDCPDLLPEALALAEGLVRPWLERRRPAELRQQG